MANKKTTWSLFQDYPGTTNSFHFYVSSLATWRTGGDLVALIDAIKKDDMPFNVYLVKLPESATYEIKSYAPDLPSDQVQHLGTWQPE